jgi:hypothetical protein
MGRQLIDIPLPYNLTEEEVVLEPHLYKSRGILENLRWLAYEYENHRLDDEELELIMRSAVLLHHKTKAPMGECLDTAIVWDRG